MDLGLTEVTHAYGAATARPVPVLRSVTWRFPSGSSTALLGRSGSGKSTLLSILGLLLTPTAGECRIGDRTGAALSDSERATVRNATIGFLFQRCHLAPALPIWKSVAMPATFARTAPLRRADVRERAHRLLSTVGLDGLGHRRPDQLSVGQRQRAALARALVLEPPVVLADEPTGSLDEETGDLVADLLLRQCTDRGVTLVLATHDRRLAALCEHRAELTAGRIAGHPSTASPR